jgi:hypothetical protein
VYLNGIAMQMPFAANVYSKTTSKYFPNVHRERDLLETSFKIILLNVR